MTGAAVKSPLLKHELKADAYRARAREAFAAADREPLPRVRDRRRAAAATWVGLAIEEDVRALARRARLPEGGE
jgi:hypothetical protein